MNEADLTKRAGKLERDNRRLKRLGVAAVMIVAALTTAPIVGAARTQTKPGSNRPAPPASEEILRMRLDFNPHDASAHKQLIAILQKKYAFRAIALEDATWIKNNPSDTLALIELESYSKTALHDPEFAIAQLRSHLAGVRRADDPQDYDYFMDDLAGLLLKRGKPEEALPLLVNLVRLNPSDAGLWGDYGDCLSALNRKAEALQAYEHAVSLDPSDEILHEGLADTFMKFGKFSRAESEYRAAISVYNVEYKTGQPTDSAHSWLRKMVKIEAASHSENALAEMRLKLAHALLLEHKYGEAIVQTEAALKASNTEFAAFYLRAEIYDAEGDHDQAAKTRATASSLILKEAASESAKGTRKDTPQFDPRVGFLFLMDSLWNGESGPPAFPSEIVSILEPRGDNLSPVERVMLATAYFSLKQVAKGKWEWEKAIASDTKLDNAVNQANLGDELLKAGDFSDAAFHLQRAYELDPQNVTYRMDYEAAQKSTLTHAGRPGDNLP